MKSLFPANTETGAVGSGDDAWLLSVPRSSSHRLRVGHGQDVLAVDMVVGLFGQFYRFYSLQVSPGNGSIKTEILPQRTG